MGKSLVSCFFETQCMYPLELCLKLWTWKISPNIALSQRVCMLLTLIKKPMLKLRCIYFDLSYCTIIPSGVHPRVEMTHVASLTVFLRGASLESLCDVMQRPDGHDQRAYSTGICDNPTETGYFCQMIAPTFKLHMTSTLIVDL